MAQTDSLPLTNEAYQERDTENRDIPSKKFLTERDMKELEYENLINALDSTGWIIYGTEGAAELLGMNPSTLRSRLKTLGIKQLLPILLYYIVSNHLREEQC